ncbi:hypothetical protein [Bradyrhizobium sp.]|jgi:hypothetical protein|uniref:hypothetical protein n=1 Tax=Bradyrhizobium sp. TaxID=376 RepID=UPI002E09FD44|nr:hypothetical protein [Bradyrhizobium sp.]
MTVEDIERAVERLDGDDFARFRDWFSRLAADRFDRAIEDDVLSGRLDAFLEEALAEDRAGRTTPL